MKSLLRSPGCALLIGFILAAEFTLQTAFYTGAPVEPWTHPRPLRDPFTAVVIPSILALAIAALISVRGRRLITVGACVIGLVAGYAFMVTSLNQPEQVRYINDTAVPLSIFYARQGDDHLSPIKSTPIMPGESYKGYGGSDEDGRTLRIVATLGDGQRVFDHTFDWGLLSQMGNEVVFTSETPLP